MASRRVTVFVPQQLYNVVEMLASKQYRSVSGFITIAIRRHCEQLTGIEDSRRTPSVTTDDHKVTDQHHNDVEVRPGEFPGDYFGNEED